MITIIMITIFLTSTECTVRTVAASLLLWNNILPAGGSVTTISCTVYFPVAAAWTSVQISGTNAGTEMISETSENLVWANANKIFLKVTIYKFQIIIDDETRSATSLSLTFAHPHTHWSVSSCCHARLDSSLQISTVDDFQPQVRVTQSQEPPHLMSLFQGKPMIIHSGGTSRKGGQSQAAATRLFHIRQSSAHGTRAVEVNCHPSVNSLTYIWMAVPPKCHCLSTFFPQVEAIASNLNTNDVFVLKSPKGLFVWRGVGASDEEMGAAKAVVDFLGGSPTQVSEGKEPGEYVEKEIVQRKKFSCI